MSPDPAAVRAYLRDLQEQVCVALSKADGGAGFVEDAEETEGGGLSAPRVLEGGEVIERAGVCFTHSLGDALPAAATSRRPQLAGRAFEAISLSLIVHPRNPMAPTTHANFRCFVATEPNAAPVWWFGGGFDLTPIYGFDEDAVHWHQTAKTACEPYASGLYAELKNACDDYFRLPHRDEARGIGGVFFDDFKLDSWARSFSFLQSIGDAFLPAYLPILNRRKDAEYGASERDFQLYRRGRYVEFNLLYDRGTKYGIQSGRRIEAVMCSMPPAVGWRYGFSAEPGSPEAALNERYLVPRDWAAGV